MTATVERPAEEQSWLLCAHCRSPLYAKRFRRALGVCARCGHHGRLTARERIAQLLDPESIEPIEVPPAPDDPLGFTDRLPYPERLAAARRDTGLAEAAVGARGTLEGNAVAAVAMDFGFMGGSLGGGVGEIITRTAEVALAERRPLLIVSASGGARMQEGPLSLMQMAKTSQALRRLDEAGVPTVSLVTDPTYGGVAASFASLCDVIVAEPGARMGFAGPRVIERTIGQKLPPDFQTAEFLLQHGHIDAIRARAELRPALRRILAGLGAAGPGPAAAEPAVTDALAVDPDELTTQDPWQTVRTARATERPTALDFIGLLVGDFEELHGDRIGGDCPATVGGVGLLDGQPVMVIGQQKGHTPAELTARNFGMPVPAGYRKAGRLMRLAEKAGIPVVTFVDTGGAYPGVEAEQNGQAAAIAENIRLMSGLRVPVVSVVLSEGGSGGALGLAVADRVLMLENAFYSVISPEGCAAILWRDPAAAAIAAAELGLTAPRLLATGVVDGVVREPPGGAQADHFAAADALSAALRSVLADLRTRSTAELLESRHARFRRFGAT
ncbi:acetyl-CoA carboxylase carboxyl transferase subunit alpha [Couchioplanes caeruleus]|uniref:acetyl-CoA carboxylase carboxyl transferase subunit alpha n=1 Tax=Couchioplanes caeruleus TaxID=56438 RepID=UPI00201B9B11|nr:acetyl-CoA carboxylase carboxyl transferase subunit alpha [Couchioplanes caeruleus]UQU67693.1 acetyl-CoA carboxylase carboxyl transferase subunit alpha [Couchioplanes caeruleus]